jgi:DEAD/DEAH box helicase domain-containing protein
VDTRTTAAARLTADPRRAAAVTHVEHLPARAGTSAPWPDWADQVLLSRLRAAGVALPWTHQRDVADLVHAGTHTVVATGTASGKSLAYQLPVLSGLLADPRARALYLAPTKALATDQLRALRALHLTGIRAATLDGDTPREERDWVRAHGTYVLSNPDMLHRTVLPRHQQWQALLRGLRWVVVDECHVYRGVFGSGVSSVLRRLRRICARYGTYPTFVLASATVAEPERAAGRLTGLNVQAVTVDGSPHGAQDFLLYEPPFSALTGENGAPVRRSALAETGDLLADLVSSGVRTLAFVRSRRGAEAVAAGARRGLVELGLEGRVAAYRAGYLPEERRALEAALQSGDLLGVAATNALELGVDISGLDAVVVAGWPGTVASLRQQAGRAGRDGADSLAVFVARDDPLDTYLVHHPEAVFGRPVEASVCDPGNPYVLGPQLECAAAELPLTDGDLDLFDPAAATPVLEDLVRRGRLRRRAGGGYWARAGERPDADLRGGGGPVVSLVEDATGRLLGTVDAYAAHRSAHEGAVYVHQGMSYVVEALDLDRSVALLTAATPDWTTSAREVTDIRLVETLRARHRAHVDLAFATVEVSSRVTSYLRTRLISGEVLGEVPLELPERRLTTRAVLYTVTDELLERARVAPEDVPGSAHAAEHAAIGLLPLLATCDRWDLGGVSTAGHADTGRATVFVYDGHPGGAGFAEQGYVRAGQWLRATRDAVAACGCATGCPSCVQSPKCGNGNAPLDKAGGVRLLDAVLAELG